LNRPVVNDLVRTYDLEFNILRAEVTPDEKGFVALELTGDTDKFKAGIAWVEELGVTVEPLSEDVTRKDDRCTQCGACVTSCPVQALARNPENQHIGFDQDKCIGCGICVKVCPPRAMVVTF
jgi:ferredoxin